MSEKLNEKLTPMDILLAEQQYEKEKTIITDKIHIDMCEDLIAGMLLSRILYWLLPSQEGKVRAKAYKKDDDGVVYPWLFKKMEDWERDIRISVKQYRRAIDILEKKGFVKKKLFKSYGAPTTHIRLIPEKVLEQQAFFKQKYVEELGLEMQKNVKEEAETIDNTGLCPKGQIHLTERDKSITKVYNKSFKLNIIINNNNVFKENVEEFKNLLVEKTNEIKPLIYGLNEKDLEVLLKDLQQRSSIKKSFEFKNPFGECIFRAPAAVVLFGMLDKGKQKTKWGIEIKTSYQNMAKAIVKYVQLYGRVPTTEEMEYMDKQLARKEVTPTILTGAFTLALKEERSRLSSSFETYITQSIEINKYDGKSKIYEAKQEQKQQEKNKNNFRELEDLGDF